MAQLLSNLPIGAKVKFGKYSVSGGAAMPITWIVVAKNHISNPAYPTNSVTLMTDKIIDVFPLDVAEPLNPNIEIGMYGNSNYRYSNLDQWLNKDSSAGNWYTSAHSFDQAPTDEQVIGGRGYAENPGFLNAFTSDEKNIILNTTIRAKTAGVTTYDITRKVFIPSAVEVGSMNQSVDEGATFEYFNISSGLKCGVTEQVFNDVTLSYQYKPSTIAGTYTWWTRSCPSPYNLYIITDTGGITNYWSTYPYGVRPTLNLPSSAEISDTMDSDGTYTFVWNTAPLSPTNLYVPSSVYGGKSNTISWNKAVDIDDDILTYQLECSIDGGEYAQIYEGTAITYAHLVPFGTSTVSYRIKATDPMGESSAYTTSATFNIINNNAPVISGSDANLGVKSDEFSGTYTITDANSDIVTVTEAIDGVQIRSLVATLGQAITYGVTENTWLALPNGSHTLTISATDGIDVSVRTYTFSKLVNTLKIMNSTPWVSSTMPSRIMLVVTRNIPSTATFKVEVCNNGFDTSPTWENATDAVMSGLVHVFENKKKTASDWGVLVRVTVERNGATGACYISAIGGNFE